MKMPLTHKKKPQTMKSPIHQAFQASNSITSSLRLLSFLPLPKTPSNPPLAREKNLHSFHSSHPINSHPQTNNPSITELKTQNVLITKTPPQTSDTHAANCLADAYLKSGSSSDALQVLGRIPHPNLISWNLMISCYNKSFRFDNSLRTFSNLWSSGIEPNQFTYGSILSACTASQNLEFGDQAYSLVLKNGFLSNGYVSTGLIDLYAKNCCLDDALRVFSESPSENVVCWNAMISGGVRNGEHLVALDLFCRMVQGFCMPNGFTFPSVLCACAAAGELDVGRGVHAWVVKCNAEDVFVGTAIIDLYAKCGDMEAAVKKFSHMPIRNVASWTAVISGFVQEENAIAAMKFFSQMIQTSTEINKCTLTSVLIACAKSLMEKETLQIHCWTLKTGLFMDMVVKDALISTYAKIGNILMSEKIFKEIDKSKSVGAWSAMISGLAQRQSSRRSIQLFQSMFREGLKPDTKCSSSVLSIVDCVNFGRQIHSYIVKVGLVLDLLVASALFTMYSKCGNIQDSYEIFQQMQERDRTSWTSMISGFAGHDRADEALQLFREMLLEGINPDQMTISAVLTACCNHQLLKKGKEIHGHALRVGFGFDTLTGSSLISMYSKCRNLASARRVFDGIPQNDQVMWSSLISGYATNGYKEEALLEFHKMVINGFQIDHITSSSIIGLCAYLSRPGLGMQLHAQAIKIGSIFYLSLNSALVTMYSRCGSLDDSQRVFDEIENPDLVTWTAMIDGYAKHGNGVEALKVFQLMNETRIKPDSVTLVSVLSACSHCGLMEEAFLHFNSMSTDYGIEPEAHHYACMVDLLGRSGRLNEAADFIARMPIEPDTLVWSTLLGACRAHGDVELGRTAAKKVLEKEPQDSGAYIFVSNISADMGDWEEVTRIRSSMKDGGIKKEPGWSMV